MCEGAGWGYVENGERVFAILHAPSGEDDADKVDAGISEERKRRRLGEKLDVDGGDVADHISGIVENGQRGDAFIEK